MRQTLTRVWEGLGHEHRAFAVQVMRYGVVGVCLTLFTIGVYNLLIGSAHMRPLLANTLATGIAMVIGYTVHSRYTFDGHGERDSELKAIGRFIATNTAGYAVNCLWIWLFTSALHLSPHWPSLPMFFVTPALLFYLNRKWVFE